MSHIQHYCCNKQCDENSGDPKKIVHLTGSPFAMAEDLVKSSRKYPLVPLCMANVTGKSMTFQKRQNVHLPCDPPLASHDTKDSSLQRPCSKVKYKTWQELIKRLLALGCM